MSNKNADTANMMTFDPEIARTIPIYTANLNSHQLSVALLAALAQPINANYLAASKWSRSPGRARLPVHKAGTLSQCKQTPGAQA